MTALRTAEVAPANQPRAHAQKGKVEVSKQPTLRFLALIERVGLEESLLMWRWKLRQRGHLPTAAAWEKARIRHEEYLT